MNGNKFFLDTNIVQNLLGGDTTLANLLHEKQIYLSFISELELLGYRGLTEKEKLIVKEFLSDCEIVDINTKIKSHVIELVQTSNLKLPDCIILASSLYLDLPFVSADSDFKNIQNIDLIYYEQ